MKKRGAIPVEEAQSIMMSCTPSMKKTETVGLLSAVGRVLAEDLYSAFDNPPFDRSPLDGYALKAADIRGASKEAPAVLKVLCEIDAGGFYEGTVGVGECVRIMTGAAIPAGCDCVVRQEDTDYGEETAAFYTDTEPDANYCHAGEDFRKGTLMLRAGTRLGYVEIAVMASMGLEHCQVYAKPRIAVFTTGDEIVMPGNPLLAGKIYNSNLFGLLARMREFGIEPVMSDQISDDPAEVAKKLKEACDTCDLVITTGGVSVGKKDIMHDALPMLGAERKFWGVALKPGMPTIFSVYEDVPIVSLSGNPFGVLANFELMLRPMLAKMSRDMTWLPVRREGVMADEFRKASKGRRFIRATWRDGKIYLPEGLHSSGVLASMQGCNCMIDIQAGTPGLLTGDTVKVVMLDPDRTGTATRVEGAYRIASI